MINRNTIEQSEFKVSPVDDPANWEANELSESDNWIHELNDTELAEICDAVDNYVRSDRPIAEMSESDFPLPSLNLRLRKIEKALIHGRGIALIRNLPVEQFTRLEAAIAYWGIGLRLGVPVSQNGRGHLLGHVKNLSGDDFETETHRGYHTSTELPWHADSCDVVGLLCLKTAKSGGESFVVSSIKIHNEIVSRRPDLAAELTKPWYRDRRGEIPKGMDPWWKLPVFNFVDGKLVTSWQGKYIRAAQRFEELPRFTSGQIEALQLFTDLAEEHAYSMTFEPGDIQLLHNHVVLHRRSNYQDHDSPGKKRHLLRLWLATPSGRALPQGLIDRYGILGPSGRPAGIYLPGTKGTIPLDAK